MQKKCKVCEEVKPLDDYYDMPKCKDGKRGLCKQCHKLRAKRWQHANPERYRKTAKRFYHNNREKLLQRHKEYLQQHPEKTAARLATRKAIRDGVLVPQDCEGCGTTKNIEAHHSDYSNHLDITWFCRRCHQKHHARENEVALEL